MSTASRPRHRPRPGAAAARARAAYDPAVVHAILDEALVCHVGFGLEGQPYVIPTIYARVGEIALRPRLGGQPHAAHAAGGRAGLRDRDPAGRPGAGPLRVPPLDELPVGGGPRARARRSRTREEKRDALRAIVEHVVPGRSAEVRDPSEKEIKATLVLRLSLEEASAKIRSGPPLDDEEDYAIACWAGEIPLRIRPQTPVSDGRVLPGVLAPETVVAYSRPGWGKLAP